MAGVGTVLNEPHISLWRGGYPEGVGTREGGWPVCCVPHATDSFSLSALTREQIRIRDPNQGGKDITEEIMSGARTSSTPTPPQVIGPPTP